MSGSVCALGHPLPESQLLCQVCGLGRLPDAQPDPPVQSVESAAAPDQLQFAAAPAAGAQWAPPPPPPPPTQQWAAYPPPADGGPAFYPASPYGSPPPQQSRRWVLISVVAVVAVLAVAGAGLAWWSQRPDPSATGSVQADGTTVVNSRGIHIVTPVGWVVVSTTQAALAKAGKSLAQSNPQLASALHGLESRQQRNILRFFAYGKPTPDGKISDADVLVSDTILPLGSVVDGNEADLKSTGAVNIQESPIPGEANAEQLTYRLPLTVAQGRTLTFSVDQVYVSKGSEIGILTLGTTAASDPSFSTMVNSFRLT